MPQGGGKWMACRPDARETRHVFAFMFWILYCKVAAFWNRVISCYPPSSTTTTAIFSCRTIPLIQPSAKVNTRSITTALRTRPRTWRVTTPVPPPPPPRPRTPCRSRPPASPARPSPNPLQVRPRPLSAPLCSFCCPVSPCHWRWPEYELCMSFVCSIT